MVSDPRGLVRTLANVVCCRRQVSLIHLRPRDERVCAIKLRDGGRRRWGLRIRGGKQTCKPRDPQPSNVLLHVLALASSWPSSPPRKRGSRATGCGLAELDSHFRDRAVRETFLARAMGCRLSYHPQLVL